MGRSDLHGDSPECRDLLPSYSSGNICYAGIRFVRGRFLNVKFRGDWIEAAILSEPMGPGVLSGCILRIEAFPKRPQVLLDQLTAGHIFRLGYLKAFLCASIKI